MALLAVAGCARGVQPRPSTAPRRWVPARSIPRTSSRATFPPTGSASIPTTSPRWPICVRCAGSTRAACSPATRWPRSAKSAPWERFSRSTNAIVDIKVPGEADRHYVSIEVIFYRMAGQPVAFLAGDLPVYETYPGSCDYLLPLNLSLLPGAQPLRQLDQPFVRVGLIAEENCDFAQRLARAIAPTVESLRLPVRDAVAVYPRRAGRAGSVPGAVGGRHARSSAGTSLVPGRTNAHFGIIARQRTSCRYRCRWSRRCTTWRPRPGSTANATVSSCSSTRCTARRWRSSAPRCSAGCSAATSSARARSSSGPRWWWTAAASTATSSPTWRSTAAKLYT